MDESCPLPVDHVYGHDRNTFKILDELGRRGADLVGIAAGDRLRLWMDHYSPPPTEELGELHQQQRMLAATVGAEIHEEGSGVGHQLAVELTVGSLEVAVGVDSHTCTVGALGALGVRQPPPAVAAALDLGWLRFDMPRVLRLELRGELPQGCVGHDIALHLARLGQDRLEDCMLEVGGEGLASLQMAERFTLANLSVDLHARSAIFETDSITKGWFEAHGRASRFVEVKAPVEGYDDVIALDLGTIQPMIAPPPTLFGAIPVCDLQGDVRVDVVTVGSCSAGRVADLHAFLDEMGNDRPSPGVRLIVTPSSRRVLQAWVADGSLTRLLDLGAILNPPGCGPCMGLHQGTLSAGETCVATGSRNQPGRMGSQTAKIYLAGPRVAAAAWRHGCVRPPSTPS